MLLFLDDSKERIKKFKSSYPFATIVETSEETILQLQKSKFKIVSLDHDLGGEIYVDSGREDTGMGVVRWIIENKPQIELIIVHSLNDDGSLNMMSYLRSAGYNAVRTPFTNLIQYLDDIIGDYNGCDQ